MRLSQVLKSVREEKPATEKTAAASPAESSGEKLKTALHEALLPSSAAAETKQAASTPASPVEDLQKIASQVAASEQEALMKEAQFYGAAVADGFMARLSQYNEAAEKIASQNQTPGLAVSALPQLSAPVKVATEDSFEKFASENPQLVKEAAELGFNTTLQQMDKLAEAAHKKGFEEATTAIYKLAHSTFVRGFQDTSTLLQRLKG
jgi:hypothetical protein